MIPPSTPINHQQAEKLARQIVAEQTPAAPRWADQLVCWFMRHWLAIFLTPLLLFVLLPFVAPIAMAQGWTGAGALIYHLYIPFCHQLPQRSYFLFGPQFTYTLPEIQQVFPSADPWQLRFFYGTPEMGWKVAWSDRMVSFYFLTPVFALVYAALRQTGRRIKPISIPLLVFTLTPIFLDGVSHIISDAIYGISGGGFRDTNQWLAILTGNAWPGFYAGDHFGTFNWWLRLLTGILAAWGLAFFGFPHLDRLFARESRQACGKVSSGA